MRYANNLLIGLCFITFASFSLIAGGEGADWQRIDEDFSTGDSNTQLVQKKDAFRFYISEYGLKMMNGSYGIVANFYQNHQRLVAAQEYRDKQAVIEHSKPPFYRLRFGSVDLPFYVLGTNHYLPLAVLPRRVLKVLERLSEDDETVFISELGSGGSDFFDDREAPLRQKAEKVLQKYPALKYDREKDGLGDNWLENKNTDIQAFKRNWIAVVGDSKEVDESLELFSFFSPLLVKELISNILVTSMGQRTYIKGMDAELDERGEGKQFCALDSISLRKDAFYKGVLYKMENKVETSRVSVGSILFALGYYSGELVKYSGENSPKLRNLELRDVDFKDLSLREYLMDEMDVRRCEAPSLEHRNKAWVPIILRQALECFISGVPRLAYNGVGHLGGKVGLPTLMKPYGVEFLRINQHGQFVPLSDWTG